MNNEVINIEEMQRNLEKIKMYYRDIQTVFDKIVAEFEGLNKNYITDNTSKLIQFCNSLADKYFVMKINQYDNEVILFKTISKYSNLSQLVAKMFKNLI